MEAIANDTRVENEPQLPEDIWEFCYNASSTNVSRSEVSPVFWVEGIGLSVTSLVGIIGNIVTIIVLNRISLNNVFNQLIVMLCIIDSLFAGFSFLEYGLKKGLKLISYTTPIYVNLWPKFLYPLHTITNTLSLFVTLAIAIERYIAICHPFLLQQERLKPNRSAAAQSQQSSTNGMSLKKRTCLYMLPVILISFLVNIPKFMEFRNTTRMNQRGMNQTFIEPTEMRLDPRYTTYYLSWTRAFLLALFPFVLLLILNGKIIRQLKKSENISSSARTSSQQKKEAKLARILILIVFFFLFCNIGKVALTLYDLYNLNKIRICEENRLVIVTPLWVVFTVSFNHMLLVMNSSANIFLFLITGTQFRATFLAMMRLRRPPSSPVTPSKPDPSPLRNSEGTSARTAMTYSKENEVEIDDDRNDIADDDEAVFIDDAEPKRRNTLATMKVKLSREKPCVQIELLTTVNGNCRRHQ